MMARAPDERNRFIYQALPCSFWLTADHGLGTSPPPSRAAHPLNSVVRLKGAPLRIRTGRDTHSQEFSNAATTAGIRPQSLGVVLLKLPNDLSCGFDLVNAKQFLKDPHCNLKATLQRAGVVLLDSMIFTGVGLAFAIKLVRT